MELDFLKGCKITGTFSLRSWCRENINWMRMIHAHPELRTDFTRFWEYPWLLSKVGILHDKKGKQTVLDIGAGDGSLASVLTKIGKTVTAVDNYEGGWEELGENFKKRQEGNSIEFHNADCTNLNMFKDNTFDFAVLCSVIEHIPSNAIYCETKGRMKIKEDVDAEYPIKRKVIEEAVRVVKKGGRVILTTDLYLSHSDDVNLSMKRLLGLTGVDIEDITQEIANDLFICDNPIHKGKVSAIGVVIEKG